ncbi:unnamed protein product [Cylicocyclus nassatus]|uniref:Uncharacterized protein n=1 Tax=Cylicocyclus nassatus TaxID=53992 RepID=A0AA36GKD7_CYLNA|nr:unnamed protein product [Cylicocyclus nassatus]
MNVKDSLMISMLWLCKILWLTIILTSSASCSSKENSNKRPRRRRPRPPGQAALEGSKEEAKKDSKEPLASCETKEKKDKEKVVKDEEKKEEDTQVASLSPQNPLLGELADTQDFLESDKIKATQGED